METRLLRSRRSCEHPHSPAPSLEPAQPPSEAWSPEVWFREGPAQIRAEVHATPAGDAHNHSQPGRRARLPGLSEDCVEGPGRAEEPGEDASRPGLPEQPGEPGSPGQDRAPQP